MFIEDIQKGEVVSQITCLITLSKDTQFSASKKNKAITNKLYIEKDTENNIEDCFFEEESNKKYFDRDF